MSHGAITISQEVVEQVCELWRGATHAPRFPSSRPAPAVAAPTFDDWSSLLHVCLATSLTTDEGRAARFRVAFSVNLDCPLSAETRLDPPVPANSAELAKLVHVLWSPVSLIWLGGAPQRILGVQSSWATLDTESIEWSGNPLPLPVIEVTGPGRLRVLKGDRPVCTIDVEGIRSIPPYSSFGFGVLRATKAWLDDAYLRLTETLAASSDQAPKLHVLREACEARTVDALQQIVAGIQSRRHGGMLALLPERRNWTSHTRPRYQTPSTGTSLGNLLTPVYLTDGYLLLDDEAGKTTDELEQLRTHHLNLLAQRCQSISGLSGVDGAVVMTSELDLWGFGVELLSERNGDLDEDVCYHATLTGPGVPHVFDQTRFTQFGTRHRSAFRLCRDVPDAVCFVVSQDGTVKVIANHGGRVLFFDRVEDEFS